MKVKGLSSRWPSLLCAALFVTLLMATFCTPGVSRADDATQAADGSAPVPELTTAQDIVGKRIGLGVGSSYEYSLVENYDGISKDDFQFFNSLSEEIGALKSNKIDVIMDDYPVAQLAVNRNEGIALIPETILEQTYGFVLQKNSPLTAPLGDALQRLNEEGAIDDVWERWTGADESLKVLPPMDWDTPNGTLVAAVSPDNEPAAYIRDGELAGAVIEIMYLLAREAGYGVEFRKITFPSMFAEVKSGKSDLGIQILCVTEERLETLDMIYPIHIGGATAIVRAVEGTGSQTGFLEGVASSFEKTFIRESRWESILLGLGVTILITLSSAVLGTLLGMLTMMWRRGGGRIASVVVGAYEGLMSRTPIVVVLMVLYYIVFGKVNVSALAVAILAFTLSFGATAGSIMWNAVQAVDVGQTEASLALGFTDLDSFRGVVLPQAARQFMPLLSGQLVGLAKDTSVVGYIAVEDLTRVSDLIRSRTMEAFFPLLSTAAIYFALCCALAWGMGFVIRRFDFDQRARTIKGVKL